MKVIMVANEEQQEEIKSKHTGPGTELLFVKDIADTSLYMKYDAIFYFYEEDDKDLRNVVDKPVFINSVTHTLQQKNLPLNFSRFNGWRGFSKRNTWEVASNNTVVAAEVFESLHWNVVFVKDEPGLVAARIISLIINEAFMALEDGISSAAEIDLAMKLGTNYPYGPFEWQEKIGVSNIFHLLKALSIKEKRYAVSSLLEKKYFEYTASQKT